MLAISEPTEINGNKVVSLLAAILCFAAFFPFWLFNNSKAVHWVFILLSRFLDRALSRSTFSRRCIKTVILKVRLLIFLLGSFHLISAQGDGPRTMFLAPVNP